MKQAGRRGGGWFRGRMLGGGGVAGGSGGGEGRSGKGGRRTDDLLTACFCGQVIYLGN